MRNAAVNTSILDRNFIRCRLAQEPFAGPLNGDFRVAGRDRDEAETTRAAVLVPIVCHLQGFTVLLTRRTDHLHHHPGQVSFPGGRAEGEDEHPESTAVRETEEEIGLGRESLEMAGYLDTYQTVTGFLVTPVVAFVRPGFELRVDEFEVAEVFEVPLDFVLDPRNHEMRSLMFNGEERRFYVLPYRHYYVWGATAAMLVNLYSKLQ